MKVYLLRHGKTSWNNEGRYQGLSDIPLSQEGMSALRPADFSAKTVYVSPLLRARQTAAILFPDAVLKAEPGLQEMDFGVFEGRNAQEMEKDSAYRAWVDGGCMGKVPGGESVEEFTERVCRTFTRLLENTREEDPLVIVAHGGTLMGILSRYAEPHHDFFAWQAPNGGGWLLETADGSLRVLQPVCCTKDGASC